VNFHLLLQRYLVLKYIVYSFFLSFEKVSIDHITAYRRQGVRIKSIDFAGKRFVQVKIEFADDTRQIPGQPTEKLKVV